MTRNTIIIGSNLYAILLEIASKISQSETLNELVSYLNQRLKYFLDFQHCTLTLINGNTHSAYLIYSISHADATDSAHNRPLQNSLTEYLIKQDSPILEKTNSNTKAWKTKEPMLAEDETQYILGIPVLDGMTIIGGLFFSAKNDAFSELDRRLFGDFGYILGANIKKIQLQTELQGLAYFDKLTTLYNRASLDDILNKVLSISKRHNYVFSLLFLDLDAFKYINDTYGHDAGDKLLQDVAMRLKNSVRTEDCVARLGGDEFVIVLRNLRVKAEAKQFANTIISSFNEPFLINNKAIKTSISIGIATFPHDATDSEGLLKAADKAMYDAKAQGKNKVIEFGA
tara:strand:+ start:41599 stop:42624 length:1026 start_codon:yes stop_codon:yes gene_type:complete